MNALHNSKLTENAQILRKNMTNEEKVLLEQYVSFRMMEFNKGMEYVNFLLNSYDFEGDNTPVIRGSALKAFEGDFVWEDKITELMNKVDEWILNSKQNIECDCGKIKVKTKKNPSLHRPQRGAFLSILFQKLGGGYF